MNSDVLNRQTQVGAPGRGTRRAPRMILGTLSALVISRGYALTMLALLVLWGACDWPHQRGRWLAAASLAYGLAIVALATQAAPSPPPNTPMNR